MATDSIPHKFCAECKQGFPATTDFFSPSKLGRYGLRTKCKPCEAKCAVRKRQERGSTPRKNRRHGNEKQCSNCEAWLPATSKYFGVTKHHSDGLRSWCRKCLRKTCRIYQKAYRHRDGRNRSRKHEAIRLAREVSNKGDSYTQEDVEMHLRTQKHRCWWCGVKLKEINYHVDHRIPLSRGGSNKADNICITCADCNLHKYNKLPHEFNGRLL